MTKCFKVVVAATLIAAILGSPLAQHAVVSGFEIDSLAGHRVVRTFDLAAEGMFSPSVRALFEASDGRIWAGTRSGCAVLNEDETRWQTYTPYEVDMVEGGVQLIAESDDHKVWFAQRGNPLYTNLGVTCFDGERWQKLDATNSPLRRSRGETYPIQAMFSDRGGKLYLALEDRLLTYSHGLWCLNGSFSKLFHLTKSLSLNTAMEDSQGSIWIGGLGIARIDMVRMRARAIDLMKAIRYSDACPSAFTRSRATLLTCLYQGGHGKIWAAANNYLYMHDQGTGSWQAWRLLEHVKPSTPSAESLNSTGENVRVNAICEDRAGVVLLATNYGLLTVRGSQDWTEVSFELYTPGNSALA